MGFKNYCKSEMLPLLRTSKVSFCQRIVQDNKVLDNSLQTQEGIQMAGGCHRALISKGNAGHSTRIISIPRLWWANDDDPLTPLRSCLNDNIVRCVIFMCVVTLRVAAAAAVEANLLFLNTAQEDLQCQPGSASPCLTQDCYDESHKCPRSGCQRNWKLAPFGSSIVQPRNHHSCHRVCNPQNG